jgi:hypothetical protein
MKEQNLLIGATPSRHTVEAGMAFDYLFGGARLPGRMIHFGVDRLDPW